MEYPMSSPAGYKHIQLRVATALNNLGIQEDRNITISIPENTEHGDYTTNIAMQAFVSVTRHASRVKKKFPSPFALAREIASSFTRTSSPVFEKVEAVPPGFINFYISKEYLMTNLENVLDHPNEVGKTKVLKGKKIIIEFTDPNPFKEFHIGHVYTNTVGEAISRLLEANGATVWRADYFGDVGMHVAKSLWGLEQKLKEDTIDIQDLQKKSLHERIKYLGQAYAKGSRAYESDKKIQEDVKIINKLVFIAAQKMWEEKNITPHIDYKKDVAIDENQCKRIYNLYTTGREWSLTYFDSLYKRLGMQFDGYYPESIAGEKGYKLVKDHIQDGVFEYHDGAIIFKGEKYGFHTRVFINSLGLPTYEAKELGLAPWKYEEFPYDQSIIVTGNEITEYFKVLIAAMSAINPDLGKKTRHVPHGMVRLPEGKMSSRTGKIITGAWLLDEAEKRAKEKIKEAKRGKNDSSMKSEPTNNELEKISDKVGIGAIKYALLKSGIGKDIEFDFDTSVSFEGNSGPYIQYSYVRTQSILEKALSVMFHASQFTQYTFHPQERMLLRLMHQFPEVVQEAGENLAPHILCTYLYELAKQFNLFYQTQRILDAKTQEEKAFRLSLTAAIGHILQQGLSFLGIAAPERM